jgi:hypothetical protein
MEPFVKLHAKWPGMRPPLDETLVAMKEAGYSEERIKSYRDKAIQHEKDLVKKQGVIDKIFDKYPSANKTKKKVIKAVKKKS